jgi:hypothetical protein
METKIDAIVETVGDLLTKADFIDLLRGILSEFDSRERCLLNEFKLELEKRDARITELKHITRSTFTAPPYDDIPVEDVPNDLVSILHKPLIDNRIHRKTLLIGDSIIRHINVG